MYDLFEVNKYGAVDVRHIKDIEDKLKNTKDDLDKALDLIKRLFAELGYEFKTEFAYGYFGISGDYRRVDYSETLMLRLKKLEDLTKANDYEYVTETKLVKKNKVKK